MNPPALVSRRRSRAFALVIMLCLTVIASTVLIAFVSVMQNDRQATQSYSQSFRAEQIAQGALTNIESQIIDEIAANSTRYGKDGTTTNAEPPYVYEPLPDSTGNFPSMVLSKTHPDAPFPLKKISKSGVPFFVGGQALASGAESTEAGANGRRFTKSRWNKPQFLSSWPADFPVPDWVNVTRTGARVVSIDDAKKAGLDNPNFVVGRYSYAIYDVSGLLNVAAAGYTSTGSNLTSEFIARKGSLALADLGRLRNGSSGSVTQDQVDSLLQWRNKGTLSDYRQYIEEVVPESGALEAEPGDNAFLNRQDLIQFATTHGFAPALANLTTFHRSVNAPSWRPLKDSNEMATYKSAMGGTSVFRYKTDSNRLNSTNRNLANIRAHAGTYKHYNDDGSATTYVLEEGDPLLQNRFSLKKLAWLTKDGPVSPALEGAIRDCFGLRWNDANRCWDYEPRSSSNQIFKLQELNDLQSQLSVPIRREPNFFELLKAGVLEGSLARSPGPVNTNGTAAYGVGANVDDLSGGPNAADTQIFRIGSNIIDQADPNDFPTTIYTGLYAVGRPEGLVNGIENLPYLLRSVQGSIDITPPTFRGVDISGPTGSPIADQNYMLSWLQPVLWNPHQKGVQVPAPSKLRIVIWGRANGSVIWSVGGALPTPGTQKSASGANAKIPMTLIQGSATFPAGAEAGWITFNAARDYRERPVPLSANYIDLSETPNVNIPWSPTDPSPVSTNPHFPARPAFFAMPLVQYDPDSTTLANWGVKGHTRYGGDPNYVSYALQWEDTPGFWRTYAIYNKLGASGSVSHGKQYREANHEPGLRLGAATGGDSFAFLDPRTDRFGTSIAWLPGYRHDSTIRISTNPVRGETFNICPPWNTAGFHYPGALITGSSFYPALLMQNAVGSQMHYSDRDGVVRAGDGFYADMTGAFASTLPNGVSTILGPPGNTIYPEGSQRPLILNRPFRSVGELGYAFRDQPFKTLDMFTDTSADTALLDIFCIEEPRISADKVNVNASSVEVLESLLYGSIKKEFDSALTLAGQTVPIASNLQANLTQNPASDRGGLVAPLSSALTSSLGNPADIPDRMNKTQREAAIRSLVEVSDVRTWNMMIDIVAQAGRYPPNASDLDGFVVEGERRYWLHVAIDRITGEIVGRQLEPVYE